MWVITSAQDKNFLSWSEILGGVGGQDVVINSSH
jgi:hypothetical protein